VDRLRLRPPGPGTDRRPARRRPGRHRAVGLIAGTDNDTTNLSLVAAGRRSNPSLFVAARQNRPASAPLFAAMELDALLVPTELVAHEVYAELSTPLLWRFLREMPAMGNAWAEELVDRLTAVCGEHLQSVWKVRLTPQEAPSVAGWLASGSARLGAILRNPEDRDEPLHAVTLIVMREREAFPGWAAARRALGTILTVDGVLEYLVTGHRVPSSWIWRRLTRTAPAEVGEAART
jgi:voltage-gated potassium channel